MNKDFEKRSKEVFEVLSILVKTDEQIIFIGGSAIQASLFTQKRISIDLDISHFGEIEKLTVCLEEAGYKVAQRQSKNPNFILFTVSKGDILVKLDVSRSKIIQTEKRNIKGLDILLPAPHYFLASKLSTLAFGTIGRLEEEHSQIIKDIFDINCLLNEKVSLKNASSDWSLIVKEQNGLRGTSYKEKECVISVQDFLLKCIGIKTEKPIISVDHLGSFNEYLVSENKRIAKFEFIVMVARTLLVLVYLKVDLEGQFYNIENKVLEESTKRDALDSAEKLLAAKNIFSEKVLHELKVSAPKALIYLKYWHEKKRGDDPILSTTSGYSNPKFG